MGWGSDPLVQTPSGWGKDPLVQTPETYGQAVERTGKAVDIAAGPGMKGYGRAALGAVEGAAAMGSGLAGDIAGAATSVLTQDPKKGAAVREAMTYQPRTETGKAGAEYVGALTAPVTKALGYVPRKLEEAGHPILGQVATAATDVLGAREVGKAGSAAVSGVRKAGEFAKQVPGAVRTLPTLPERIASAGEAAHAAQVAETAGRNALITEGQKLGMRFTPQQAGGAVGRAVSAAASRPELERAISYKNAEAAKKAAAADVNIKDVSHGTVNEAINQTIPIYRAPRDLGRVNLEGDAKWKSDLKEARNIGSEATAKDFPEDFHANVEREIKKFDRPSADANSLIDKIVSLRERASNNFKAGGAENIELARAQRKIADAMEEAIERHGEITGKGGTIAAFRAARQRLAKLYTIRDSLTEGGELDLGELEKRLNRNEPLSGNLKTLAQLKSTFDRSFQNPEKIREHPVGSLDIVMGAMAGAGHLASAGATGAAALPAVAAMAARPLTRAALASKAYQKAAIKPRVPEKSLLTRGARALAGKQTLKSLPKEAKE